MNMVIPVDISRMNDGNRILFLSSLRSKNGGLLFCSNLTKIANEVAELANAAAISGKFWELTPICMSVSAIRNEDTVAERASMPLMSIDSDLCFLSDSFLSTFVEIESTGSFCLFSRTNLAMNNVTNAANGTIVRNVA